MTDQSAPPSGEVAQTGRGGVATLDEAVSLLREANERAWPEAVILVTHPDPERQEKAKTALYAWQDKVTAFLGQLNAEK